MSDQKLFDDAMAEIKRLRADVARLRGELSVANRNRASLREALGDTTTYLEIEQRAHEETKGYRQHAEQERDALRAVVREQTSILCRIPCGNGLDAMDIMIVVRALRAALGEEE